jgi:hypothetical protein
VRRKAAHDEEAAGAMKLWVALLLLVFVSSPALADCPLDLGHGTGTVIYSDQYLIAFRPDPLRIEVGQAFALIMNVCTKAGEPAELVRVEAATAEHKRSLTGSLAIKAGSDGRYRVEGLLFPVPGTWEVAFDVRPTGKPGAEIQQLTHDFLLK